MRILVIATIAVITACTQEVNESPLTGPGFDETTGELLRTQVTFMVGLTHLEVINAPGPGAAFGEHANATASYLFEEQPSGWLGAGFRNVGRLQHWTMTVWEDEEAMMNFVLSEPHMAAISELEGFTAGAVSRSLEMSRDDLPLSWERALQLLREEQGYAIGAPVWLSE